jgi:hypothetical protein
MILAVSCDDLVLREKVVGLPWRTPNVAPVTLLKARSFRALLGKYEGTRVDVAVINLNDISDTLPEDCASLKVHLTPRILVGFCAHVDTSLMAHARDHGFSWIVPRSTFFLEACDAVYSLLISLPSPESEAV